MAPQPTPRRRIAPTPVQLSEVITATPSSTGSAQQGVTTLARYAPPSAGPQAAGTLVGRRLYWDLNKDNTVSWKVLLKANGLGKERRVVSEADICPLPLTSEPDGPVRRPDNPLAAVISRLAKEVAGATCSGSEMDSGADGSGEGESGDSDASSEGEDSDVGDESRSGSENGEEDDGGDGERLGYDEDFIDDSEPLKLRADKSLRTKFTGFYINQGSIELDRSMQAVPISKKRAAVPRAQKQGAGARTVVTGAAAAVREGASGVAAGAGGGDGLLLAKAAVPKVKAAGKAGAAAGVDAGTHKRTMDGDALQQQPATKKAKKKAISFSPTRALTLSGAALAVSPHAEAATLAPTSLGATRNLASIIAQAGQQAALVWEAGATGAFAPSAATAASNGGAAAKIAGKALVAELVRAGGQAVKADEGKPKLAKARAGQVDKLLKEPGPVQVQSCIDRCTMKVKTAGAEADSSAVQTAVAALIEELALTLHREYKFDDSDVMAAAAQLEVALTPHASADQLAAQLRELRDAALVKFTKLKASFKELVVKDWAARQVAPQPSADDDFAAPPEISPTVESKLTVLRRLCLKLNGHDHERALLEELAMMWPPQAAITADKLAGVVQHKKGQGSKARGQAATTITAGTSAAPAAPGDAATSLQRATQASQAPQPVQRPISSPAASPLQLPQQQQPPTRPGCANPAASQASQDGCRRSGGDEDGPVGTSADNEAQVAEAMQAAIRFGADKEQLERDLQRVGRSTARTVFKVLCWAGPPGLKTREIIDSANTRAYDTWDKSRHSGIHQILSKSSTTHKVFAHVGDHRYALSAFPNVVDQPKLATKAAVSAGAAGAPPTAVGGSGGGAGSSSGSGAAAGLSPQAAAILHALSSFTNPSATR